MRTLLSALVAMVFLAPSSIAASATSPAQDFKTVCIDTHGVAAPAYAAADAQGWAVATGDRTQSLMPLTGNPEGRMAGSGTQSYRILVASTATGPKRKNVCVVVALGDPAQAANEIEAALGFPAGSKKAGETTWNLMPVDGKLKPLKAISAAQFSSLSLKAPVINVVVTPVTSGTGAVFMYEENWGLTAAPAKPLASNAGDVRHFAAFIEQDGRRVPLKGVVHLKKRPFAFSFTGSKAIGYSLVAALDARALKPNPTEAQLEEIFNRFGVVAESEGSTFLVVNTDRSKPDMALSNHFWADDNDKNIHLLTVSQPGPNNTVTASHRIEQVMQNRTAVPLAEWSGKHLYVLVSGRPAQDGAPHVDPKYAELAFD